MEDYKKRILNRLAEVQKINVLMIDDSNNWDQAKMENAIAATLTLLKLTHGENSTQEIFLTRLREKYFQGHPGIPI